MTDRTKLPDFLVIGVPRAGTTWLYEALRRHPQVFLPGRRKEIHFFDRYYANGIGWYARFFRDAHADQRVGEITPHYLYDPECPRRIHELGTVRQLIVILRNPVERAISHYRWRMRQDAFRGSFEDFLVAYPEAVSWGEYYTHLSRYRDWLDRGDMLVMIYEHLFSNSHDELERIATFLDIESGLLLDFPPGKVINKAFFPRFPRMWRFGVRLGAKLRDMNLDFVINAARGIGIKRALETRQEPTTAILAENIDHLLSHYEREIDNLATLTGMDPEIWRNSDRNTKDGLHGP